MSDDPLFTPSDAAQERNWLPLAVAAGIVLAILAVLMIFMSHGKKTAQETPVNAPTDPYASSLPISGLAMSESSNLAGGKVTYIDGHIVNQGDRRVNGITVQVLFRDYTHAVAQNTTMPMMLIRTRDPYVDVQPVSAAPLKPGEARDFRLIFDTVTDSWDGAYPEVRIVHVETQ